MKTYEHVKYVYELIRKNKQVLDWKTSDFKLMRVMITISIMAIIKMNEKDNFSFISQDINIMIILLRPKYF